MTGRCLFGFSGEKPFLLPDNEGVKMNTSPVRMDDLPLNRFHCRIAALTFGAHLTDGYVLGVIGYAIIQLTPAMQLTPFMAGMIGGSALLGLFLGSLVLGWISDHIGRQKIFTFSFLLITLASFLQFFATTPEHLIGLRILIGIGLGGDYSVGHTLLAEFSPRRHRGILLGAFSVVWTVGYVLASIAGHHFISENPEAWRWLLASAALPALLITLLRWGTPESPRWLLRQGRFAEAHAIVHRYFGPHVLLGDEVVTATHKHIKTLFSSRYWRRTAFNSVFFVCLVIPWFVIYTWLPTIAQTIGLEDALTASLMLNALLIVGALLGLVLTHLLAHRKFLLGSFLLLAAQDFSGCTLAHWQIEPQPVVAEQVLDALVEQWQRTPADVVLFPPGTFGDELSTRLAWRLHGASICQVTSLDIPTVSVRKSHWGNALTATLQTEKRPLCLSLALNVGCGVRPTNQTKFNWLRLSRQSNFFANVQTPVFVVESATTPALIALRASSSSHTSPPAISGWRIFSVTQPSTLGIQPGRISIQSGFDCATCLSML